MGQLDGGGGSGGARTIDSCAGLVGCWWGTPGCSVRPSSWCAVNAPCTGFSYYARSFLVQMNISDFYGQSSTLFSGRHVFSVPLTSRSSCILSAISFEVRCEGTPLVLGTITTALRRSGSVSALLAAVSTFFSNRTSINITEGCYSKILR